MGKIGIFGGTFDPIHLGHITIAKQFVMQFDLDKCIFVPNFISPHKIDENTFFAAQERIAFIEIAIKDNPKFSIDTFEIDQALPSFTINTIEYIETKYPNNELYLLIGTDQLLKFHLWFRYKDILEKAKLVVAKRKYEKEDLSDINFIYYELRNEFIDISSTEIRKRLKNNESLTGLVPPLIASMIKNKRKS